MLPSILAKQLQQGIEDYVETTFPMTNEPFAGSVKAMFEQGDAVFHKPYLSVKLPFRKAEHMPDCFDGVELPFMPYVHQEKSYARLVGDDCCSTLVATGTGSGKTECFLNPVLEYCYHHRNPGIKALLIYPMNALATDQASRLAKAIASNEKLAKAGITAGMYIGGGRGKGATLMSAPDKEKNILGIITDHETMIHTPPDILLTNYKMLDYLLVRPKDAGLWRDNRPDTLRYIVVDEFHTFDGAQGTDLACLLRRLKSRLYIQPGYLCCIGTSATMGSKGSAKSILKYAQDVFGEHFDDHALITEDRLLPEEFFAGEERTYLSLPTEEDVAALDHLSDETDEMAYLQRAADSWFPKASFHFVGENMEERIRLGRALKQHGFFQDAIATMKGNYWQDDALAKELSGRYPQIQSWQPQEAGLDSLMALVSYARTGTAEHPMPFLFVQVQLWMRELRRLLGRVSGADVNYMLAPDLNSQQQKNYLPVVNCRDCGATGWATIQDEKHYSHIHTLESFYNLYFHASDKITLMFPGFEEKESADFAPYKICPTCHHIVPRRGDEDDEKYCPDDHGAYIPIVIPKMSSTGMSSRKHQFECPFCGSKRGLSLMGMRSTTEISASLSQMMASKFNDDKKALAFSDSVQDAAHRAGFFNSRTWRFGLRGAIQHYVQDGGAGQSLEAFITGFLRYWEAETRLTKEQFVSRFIAPNMVWMQAYKDLREKRKWGSNAAANRLWKDIEKRLSYEIQLEYGVTSRIGRTLEKSNCSCLTFDREEIRALAERVQTSVVNKINVLNTMPLPDFERMVAGWLTLARYHGAIFHEELLPFCQDNVEGRGYKPHFLIPGTGRYWMPGLQSGRNNPRFVCDYRGKGKCPNAFDAYYANYYTRWVEACIDSIDDLLRRPDLAAEISKVILQEAVEAGFLQECVSTPTITVYGLSKEKLFVSDAVCSFRCDSCGSQYSYAENLTDRMQGAKCIRRNCDGYLQKTEVDGLGYYGRLYSKGDLVRIHAYEHTGLLERENREHIENDFKRSEHEERRDWDPNVLSCTPTLELGIDIGDLSSVILCSVPPGQAQFLQRVGRAGRTDGNSLVFVVANTRPHDLYFYTDPLDMMQGSATAPHIFLRASAVLQRQFVAFCMDNWVRTGIPEEAIPKRLGQVILNLHQAGQDEFPFNYLHYVQKQLNSLFQMFIRCFDGGGQQLDERAKDELSRFVMGDGLQQSPMHEKVLTAFSDIEEEIQSINENIRTIDHMIADIHARPQDSSYEDELKELEWERQALLNVKKSIKKKDTFNFLSDEGLLPNYAFPEEGITLKAVLFRKKENADEKTKDKFENHVYEYQRAASSAISEFAPNNSFYAGGHEFTIDQVDVNSAKPERWRLCPNCAHAERETESMNRAACPNCGDPGWADAGQLRDMLQVKMVYSNMDMRKSLIDDGSDSRTVKFYTKQLLVDVNEDQDVEEAYSMANDDFPFGYEFVRKATLREINFGEADVSRTDRMYVNGEEEARKGFQICQYCGRIQEEDGKIHHAPYCPVKKNEALLNEAVEDCLFLYREFQTEVLRILIPETTAVGTSVKTESFTAAFMLGMKEYFGNVDHLRATICSVPLPNADYRKQYLVVYDSVPGGTGYLKQLMQHDDALIQIFEKALHVLETCSCKDDPNKDGCYHCLYASRQSRNIGDISRRTAIQLLRSILSGRENIQRIKKLGDVPVNHLFDSELEMEFIHVLGRYFERENRHVEIRQDIVHDKPGYILNITSRDADGEHSFSWSIEPQVSMGKPQGVSVQSRADFVLWPNFDTRADNHQHLPVVVFTDGYLYHKDIVADDTLKRGAIARSGSYRVWSLSYNDVISCYRAVDPYATDMLDAARMPGGKAYAPMVRAGQAEAVNPAKESAFDLLIDYLSMPSAEAVFRAHAKAYGMALLDVVKANKKDAFKTWYTMERKIQEETNFTMDSFQFGHCYFGLWRPNLAEDACVTCLVGLDADQQRKDRSYPPAVAICFDDRDAAPESYARDWNGFWHFCNVLQFAEQFTAVSQKGIEHQDYTPWPVPQPVGMAKDDDAALAAEEAIAPEWKQILKDAEDFGMVEETERRLLYRMAASGVPVPDYVFDEVRDDEGVIDGVELAWEKRKVAFIMKNSEQPRKNFIKKRWTVFDENVEDYMQFFGGNKV